jgi:hypothetical protein
MKPNWFTLHGDQIFTFITLASIALNGLDSIPPKVNQAILIGGILATAAHQSFFPNTPAPQAPKEP